MCIENILDTFHIVNKYFKCIDYLKYIGYICYMDLNTRNISTIHMLVLKIQLIVADICGEQ